MRKMTPIACVLVCSIQLARADVQIFINDYAGFAAVAGPLSVIDFETQPNGQPSQAGVHITQTYNYDTYGAHFSTPNVTPILAGNPVGGFSLRATIPAPEPTSRTWIIADPLDPAYAVGARYAGNSYFYAYDAQGLLIDYAYYSQPGNNNFLGIVSDVPIDYVIFDRLSWIASINDFHFAAIPEPGSVVLLAAGAGWLFRARRRACRVVPAS